MTRRPNFWKCILGVIVLALVFVGIWAATRAPKANAARMEVNNDTMTAIADRKIAAARLNALNPLDLNSIVPLSPPPPA